MEARVDRKPLLLILGLVLLIRLPFLNQAIQGDDHIYLTEAQHALIDPWHPNDVKYIFMGDEVDLRGHSHPPGNAWPLAGLILRVPSRAATASGLSTVGRTMRPAFNSNRCVIDGIISSARCVT